MPRPPALALTFAVLAALAVTAGVAAAVLENPQVASLSDAGQAGTQDARGAAVSGDGRYVAFTSRAALAGVPTGGKLELYVRDRVAGRTLLASASAAGQAADADVDDPAPSRAYAISGDGRYVVFASPATNLVDDDPDGTARDVFRKDLVTGAVAVVSRAPGGAQANDAVAGDPDVSYDGSRVVFGTGLATNLWAGDTSSASDIVMRDLTFDTSALVSVTAAGQPATQVAAAAISADGRHVAFEAFAAPTVLVRDLNTLSTITAAAGTAPDLSGDGGTVVFQAGTGVSRRDLPGGSATVVAASASSPVVSADGARVAYQTGTQILARLGTANAEPVSERVDHTTATQPSTGPAISGNGAVVAFTHKDAAPPRLADGDTNGLADTLVARLAPSDATGPQFTIAPSVDGAPSPTVRGAVGDPSGIVGVSVAGFPAVVGPSGGFAVEVPPAVGLNAIPIRATDGAGNVTETTLTREPAVPSAPPPVPKARARGLRVVRVGRRTVVRFRLDAGAKRVTTRLWRRVPRAGAPPGWTPIGPLRLVARTAGDRSAVLTRKPLHSDIYQARVGVVSAGGVAVTVLRFRVLRAQVR